MPHDTTPDPLERARAGDRAALGELLAAHQDRVYNVCLRMLGQREDAAEATQDVLLSVLQHLDGFRGEARFSTWIIRLAINQSITRLRRRREVAPGGCPRGSSNGAGERDGQGDPLARWVDTREQNPAQRVQTREMVALLQRAIGELDEPFRAALVLRDVEQMSYDEVAAVLEVSVGTVKSRLFRARLALRQAMAPPDRSSEDPPNSPPEDPPKSSSDGSSKRAERKARRGESR